MRNRRLTLVVSKTPLNSWNRPGVVLLDSLNRLQHAISTNDVERIIIDRSASADEFLQFLAELPKETPSDVMSVRDDGGAFLSSTGRGGDRVLYALSPADVGFYLQTTGVTASRSALALIP